MEFKQRQLDNGLTIIGEVYPSAQTAAMGFFVRTGSRDETPAVSGVSHFLEHMLFKGTDTLSALQVNEVFDNMGAKYNAFTSEENTVYYAAVLSEYLEEVAALWGQLMRPALRDEDFNIEKNVILQEIAMYKDLPNFEVMDQARALYFASHPCGNSVLGSQESIQAMTAEQMRQYFHHRYAPNNLALACCGNFNFDAFCKIAERMCGGWKFAEAGRTLSDFRGSPQSKHIHKAGLARHHLCLLSPAVSMQDKRRFTASLLSMIVGDDSGSRYFWELVDPAIAETAAMQFEAMDGVGAMYSYICCEPNRAGQAMEIVRNVLTKLTQNGITEKELQTAKNKVLSSITIKSEQPMGRLLGLGFNWIYSKEYRTIAQDIADIRAVTLEQANQLIQEIKPDNFTCLSMGPENQIP